jgi:hypothetical protein
MEPHVHTLGIKNLARILVRGCDIPPCHEHAASFQHCGINGKTRGVPLLGCGNCFGLDRHIYERGIYWFKAHFLPFAQTQHIVAGK